MPESFQSAQGTIGRFRTQAPDDNDFSGDNDGQYPVTRLRRQYLDYLGAKVLEWEEQKLARHYMHGSQYTAAEIRTLRARRQPIITVNEIGPKINQIVGLVERLRQEPKAYPTKPKSQNGADIATAALRNVLDGAEWDSYIASFCAEQCATEGIAGIEIKQVEGDHDDPDIEVAYIFGDDFFYDPRCYKADFTDAKFMGIAKWLDLESAIDMFPEQEDQLRTLMVETGFDMTTHSDREYKWVYVNEQRIRLIEHWYEYKGEWYFCFYCSNIELERGKSWLKDKRGKSINKFVMFSAAVDHEGDRYGFVRLFKSVQDEVNQRRSKALHISNVTRLIAQKGAVDDVETARREMSRPDGFLEFNQGFEPPKRDDKQEDLAAHLSLMQDARNKIVSFANINPALMMQSGGADEHSGVAINLLQKAGLAELGSFLRNYRNWKIRTYRSVWSAITTTWQSERWIRVGDDDNGMAQFLQLNGTGVDQYGLPVVVNYLGALDVDIRLDEGPDSVNLMQDAFDLLKQLPPGTLPPPVLIEFMNLPGSMKKRILQMLQQPPDPVAEKGKQLTLQRLEAEVGEKRAGTMHRVAQAQKTMAEAEAVPAKTAHDMRMDRHGANVSAFQTGHDAHSDTFKNFTDFLKLFQKTNALDPGDVAKEGSQQ